MKTDDRGARSRRGPGVRDEAAKAAGPDRLSS